MRINQHRRLGLSVCCTSEEKPSQSNHETQGRSRHVLDPKSTSATNYLLHQHHFLRAFPVWWMGRSAVLYAIFARHNVLWSIAARSQRRALNTDVTVSIFSGKQFLLEKNQQWTEPGNKCHHVVWSLNYFAVQYICAPVQNLFKKKNNKRGLTLWWKRAL